eukprot:2115767-Rhodomonas_salina.1
MDECGKVSVRPPPPSLRSCHMFWGTSGKLLSGDSVMIRSRCSNVPGKAQRAVIGAASKSESRSTPSLATEQFSPHCAHRTDMAEVLHATMWLSMFRKGETANCFWDATDRAERQQSIVGLPSVAGLSVASQAPVLRAEQHSRLALRVLNPNGLIVARPCSDTLACLRVKQAKRRLRRSLRLVRVRPHFSHLLAHQLQPPQPLQ